MRRICSRCFGFTRFNIDNIVLAQNDIPKLFVNADPGAILIGAPRDFCRGWKNQTEVTVPGSHFIQEDSGPAIGQAVAAWMKANVL